MLDKTGLYRKIIFLAVPITIENLIFNFMNFVDIFMVGRPNEKLNLGAAAISALGVSNQVFFIFAISLFGLMSGANVLAAQYYGAKDFKSLRKLFFVFILTSLVYVLPFLIGATYYADKIISFYSTDALVIKLGVQYLGIIKWTLPLTGIGLVISLLLRSVNLPKYTLYASIIGLVINISLNTILIPMYGVKGAATATVIARVIAIAFLIFILIKRKVKISPSFSDIKDINLSFIKKCFYISIFTFVHELMWVSAISLKASFYGKLGVNEFSSIQIANNISNLLFTLFIGITSATAVIVGNEIGNNQRERVIDYTSKILKNISILIVLSVIILNTLGPVVLKFMGVDNSIYSLTKKIIYSVSFVTIFTSYTMLFLVGIFRAGGDIKFAIAVEIIPLWCVAIPLTYYFSIVHPVPVYIVYVISYADDFIKIIPCIIRYKSNRWIKKVI